jgi:hypothetical protein
MDGKSFRPKRRFSCQVAKKIQLSPCFEQVPHPALDSIAGKEYA